MVLFIEDENGFPEASLFGGLITVNSPWSCLAMDVGVPILVVSMSPDAENNESRIYGVFDNRESALAHAEELKKEDTKNKVNPQMMSIYMQIGSEENECESFDFRKHIAFDVTQMESPVKGDVCM